MPTRSPWPGAVVDGEVASDDDFNSIPGGCIGYASTSTDTTGVGASVTDITGVTVSPTTYASRLYVVTVYVPRIASDTADDAVEVYIKQDGTIIESCFKDLSARTIGGSGGNAVYFSTAPFTTSAGSITWKASMARATGGSGILETVCDADSIAWIRVDDVGPAF